MTRAKINYFEWCRALGALAVVLMHTLIQMSAHVLPVVTPERMAAYELVEVLLTRWAVPVFLMISGALLLSPQKRMRPHYVWHYASRMLFVLATFGTAFAAMELYVDGTPVGWNLLWLALLRVLTAQTWDHLWYLYALLGLYVLLPALRWVVAHLSQRGLATLILTLAAVTMVVPFCTSVYQGDLPAAGELVTQYVPSVTYFLAGYYAHNYLRWNRVAAVCGGLALVCATGLAVACAFAGTQSGMYYLPYSPLCALFSLAFFLWARHALDDRPIADHPAFACVARYSFGVYVTHVLFLHLAVRFIGFAVLPAFVAEALLFCIALACALAFSWALHRIPVFRRFM